MRLLDLFCGAGGAAVGYYRAGFTEIVGIDINPQPLYPFQFIQADALSLPVRLEDFDLIHASPPCQGYSWTAHIHHCQQRPYPKLIEPLREILHGHAYVVENVKGAPLINPVELCGTMLGLRLRRHRLFESSLGITNLLNCSHGTEELGVYANKVTRVGTRKTPYVAGSGRTHYRPETATLAEGQAAMGINWMKLKDLSQAIPPAYTQFIGSQAIEILRGSKFSIKQGSNPNLNLERSKVEL